MDPQSAINNILQKINSIERRLNTLGGGAGQANTASNIGVGGIGLYQQKVGVDLQFRNINAGSAIITVALDAPNNEVDIDVDPSQIDLNDLGDVNAGAPANNDVLTWNLATSRWIAQAGGAAGGAENYFKHRKSERYYTHWDQYAMGTYSLLANYIYVIPFIVPVEQNFDRIALYVYGAVNRVVRLGIYEDDGDVYPGDLVHGTAELDCAASGCKEETINETLTPGLYWLAVLNGGNSGNVRALYQQYGAYSVLGRTDCATPLTINITYWGSQAYGVMPDPCTAGLDEHSNIPAIMLRKS